MAHESILDVRLPRVEDGDEEARCRDVKAAMQPLLNDTLKGSNKYREYTWVACLTGDYDATCLRASICAHIG